MYRDRHYHSTGSSQCLSCTQKLQPNNTLLSYKIRWFQSPWYVELTRLRENKFFFIHYRRHDVTGVLMKIGLRWHQLESGLAKPFYTYKYNMIISTLIDTWIKHIFRNFNSCNATIVEMNPWTYQPPRQHDFFIQEVFVNSDFNDDIIQQLNEVRLYMNLLTASDIVLLSSGHTILPNILQGANHRQSKLEWPRSTAIPAIWIQTWKTAIELVIVPLLREQPLGPWTHPTHQHWPYKSTLEEQYIHYENRCYTKITSTRTPQYKECDESERDHAQTRQIGVPADVEIRDQKLRLLGSTYISANTSTTVLPNSIIHYYNKAPHWQRRICVIILVFYWNFSTV